MASWSWDLTTHGNANAYADVEHDGRVVLTVGSTIGDAQSATVDPADFEAMCRSFIDRMAEWRQRTERA